MLAEGINSSVKFKGKFIEMNPPINKIHNKIAFVLLKMLFLHNVNLMQNE